MERLQQIADQLEETGTLNAGTVAQLRQVVDVLASTPAGPSARTAAMLAHAADVFSTRAFQNAAASLGQAADIMPSYDRTLKTRVDQLQQAADTITAAGGQLRRYGPR